MKPWSLPGLQSVGSWEDLRRFSTQALTNFSQIFSNGIGFHDNINCQVVSFNLNTGNQPVAHNLGVVPIGFIVIQNSAPYVVYNGSSAWTADTIYLSTSAPVNLDLVIIILGS